MIGRRRALAPLAAVALAAVVGGAVPPAGEAPHAFMEDEARCGECHQMERDGDDWILDPHLFSVSVVGACRQCHAEEEMGRSHPVDVDPVRLLGRRDWPEELPLHWSDDARSEVMTCGTCHNPHLPRTSKQKLYSIQQPVRGGGGYLTYYLRIRGKTTREGFTPLCHACHPGL